MRQCIWWHQKILEDLESGEENEKHCNHNIIKILKQKKKLKP